MEGSCRENRGTPHQGPVPIVDARGLRCPMPLVMTKLRLEELASGDELLVMATDAEAAIDLAAWTADEGHGLRERRGRAWTEFVIQKRVGISAQRS